MVEFNESIHFDREIAAQDIAGSIAFARANEKVGILTAHEFSEIERGFGEILKEWQAVQFVIKEGDEDIHTV